MKAHPRSILLGTITDVVLSFGAGLLLPLFGIYGSSPYLPYWSLVLGLIAVAIGGCVTAWRSSSAKVFNTIIFAAIQILIGVLGALFVPAPNWFNIASVVLTIPAALLGAYLARTYSFL